MPIRNAHDGVEVASTIGAGVPRGEFLLRVHSVFRGALNLRLDGQELLVTLIGADASDSPQGIRLEAAPDFRSWGLAPGAPGFLGPGALTLAAGAGGAVAVDLARARRLAPLPFARVGALGATFDACLAALAAEQQGRGCELRIGELLPAAGGGEGGLAARPEGRLPGVARALALAAARLDVEGARLAAGRLVGLGPGATPAGDDLLCGLLAALESASEGGVAEGAARRAFRDGLREAVAALLPATTDLGASALRCALRALFPAPLCELGAALAAGRTPEALRALRRACAQGHSSGADLCSGFLLGLASWVGPLRSTLRQAQGSGLGANGPVAAATGLQLPSGEEAA